LKLAWNVLIVVIIVTPEIMNSGHLPVSESTARRAPKAKQQRSRPRKRNASSAQPNGEREMAAVGTLTRTKSLLLAALRVWELKHRIGE
jgi:hypothetical protein